MGDIQMVSEGSGAPPEDWRAHLPPDKGETYRSFITLLRAAILLIAFSFTGLASFGFGHILPVTLGFLVILLGALSITIDLSRHSAFALSLMVLPVAVLVIAVSISH